MVQGKGSGSLGAVGDRFVLPAGVHERYLPEAALCGGYSRGPAGLAYGRMDSQKKITATGRRLLFLFPRAKIPSKGGIPYE